MGAVDLGFADRVGLALVAPRWAMAVADDPRHPGRAGSDLIRLFAIVLLCVHTRALVVAAWLTGALGPAAGGQALMSTASSAFTKPIAFLVVATAIVWIAGSALARGWRGPGRAFDLACVALIPLFAIEIVGTLALRGAGLVGVRAPAAVGLVLEAGGFAWSGTLLALALLQLRRRGAVARAS
jgi:hypothetical protein